MGLIGDFKELKQEWKGASLLKKAVVILVLFLTTSSITSLSDVVFQWRGFILEAMNFYRKWINSPLKMFFNSIGLVYTRGAIDFLTLMLMVTTSLIRLDFFMSFKLGDSRKKRRSFYFGLIVALSGMVALAYVSSGQEFNPDQSYVLLPILLLLSFSVVVLLLMKKHSNKYLLIMWTPILFAIAVVLILGAINTGLSRPLP